MILLIALVHGLLLVVLVSNVRYLRRHRRRAVLSPYPSLTVYIPARNEEENLQRLLPALLNQDYPAFDVVVYNDGSGDGTVQVLDAVDDPRLQVLHGDGPPEGWIGKVHALYRATRGRTSDLYLFLDADSRFLYEGALRCLVERFAALPERSVMTGLPTYRGGGLWLVSLIPTAILTGLPWALANRLSAPSLGALNGQCWLIRGDAYRRLEPHEAVRNEILEDVEIGRYVKRRGLVPVLLDVHGELAVHMYGRFTEAWRGFRKNAYLIMGGTPGRFALSFAGYFLAYVLAGFVSPWFFASLYAMKAVTDRFAGLPATLTVWAPLQFALGTLLQLDSAVSHWRGRVSWKGRPVHARQGAPTTP